MAPYAAALADSPHAASGCASCHAPSLAGNADLGRRVVFRMLPAAVAGSVVEGAGEDVPSEGCRNCHDTVIGQVVDRAGILMQHETCASNGACASCHGATAHQGITRVQRTFTMEVCADCHREAGASIACDVCHSAHTQYERLERGPWQVTHGAEWDQTHGLGSLTSCGVCHPSDYCVRCHGTVLPHSIGFGQAHGDEAKKEPSICYACHDPAALCTPCHGIEMPHPDGFLLRHTSLVTDVDDPGCLRCHDEDECVACHVRHVHPGNAAAPSWPRTP